MLHTVCKILLYSAQETIFKKTSSGNIKIIKGDFPEEEDEEYEDYDYNLHGTVIFIQEPGWF